MPRSADGNPTAATLVCPNDSGRARRARRVSILLLIIVILSVADLIVTVTHLRTTGMVEANPLAALIIRSTQSMWVLAGYKLATVSVSVSLLYWLRRYREGEAAAWVAVLILAALCIHWRLYAEHLPDPDDVRLAQAGIERGVWLRLE